MNKKLLGYLFVAVVVLSLLGASIGVAWAVLYKRSDNPFIYQISSVLQIPAAKLGQRKILYRDFLASRDTLEKFLDSEAAALQGVRVPLDETLEKNILEKLLTEAAMEELAEEKEISLTDEELRGFFTDVVSAASSTTPDVGLYLLQNFGWSEEDFRQKVLRPAVLEQRLGLVLAEEQKGDPNALANYLEERLKKPDVVRYLKF